MDGIHTSSSYLRSVGTLDHLQNQKKTPPSSPNFSKIMGNMIEEVNKSQHEVETTLRYFAFGKKEVHQVMMTLNRADLTLKLAVEVRNKAIEAYQEIMRMSI